MLFSILLEAKREVMGAVSSCTLFRPVVSSVVISRTCQGISSEKRSSNQSRTQTVERSIYEKAGSYVIDSETMRRFYLQSVCVGPSDCFSILFSDLS